MGSEWATSEVLLGFGSMLVFGLGDTVFLGLGLGFPVAFGAQGLEASGFSMWVFGLGVSKLELRALAFRDSLLVLVVQVSGAQRFFLSFQRVASRFRVPAVGSWIEPREEGPSRGVKDFRL